MRGGNTETMVAGKITVVQMVPEMESGGVESVTLETAAFLARQGHRSLVISAGGAMTAALERDGSRHLTWPHIGEKSPRCLKYILPLRRLLIENQVDILHLRSRVPAWIGFLAWKSLCGRGPTRLVTTFHGFYSVNAYSRIMTRGEKVIAISDTIARHIKETYPVEADRVVTIHEGIDMERFSPNAVGKERVELLRQQWGLTESNQAVIMLPARVTRLKGHDLFIKALAPIRHLNWHTLCVGAWDRQSPYYDELTALVRKTGLEGRVTFTGECDDMPAAYRVADIVVSASRHPESFGRTAVEAQAMGRQVVATAHGGSMETVGDSPLGILVPPGHVESLTRALTDAMDRIPVEKNRIDAARAFVVERFSLDRMCRDTLDLYHRMANIDKAGA